LGIRAACDAADEKQEQTENSRDELEALIAVFPAPHTPIAMLRQTSCSERCSASLRPAIKALPVFQVLNNC
jgi:hypothetical protein